MNFEFKKSSTGKIRASLCDEESHLGFGLYKNVSYLHLTYQIKLFVYRAAKEDKLLMIKVPDICELSPALLELINKVLTEDGQQRIRILRIK